MTSTIEVFNAGFPGDTTVELLKRFHRSAAEKQPDVVLLLIGSNDMFYPGHILESETYRQNLNALLDRINNIDSECILFTAPRFLPELLVENYPATLEHPLSLEQRLEAVNTVIRNTADERNINLIDLYSLIDPVDDSIDSLIMNPANSGRRDGMHLTAAGTRIMARAAAEMIRQYFPQAEKIVCLGDSITYGVYLRGKGTANIDAETYPGLLGKLLSCTV